MKPKTMILMGVAIVFGLAASYLTSQLLAKQQEKVIVLVAKEKLNRWTPLKNLDAQFEPSEILQTDMPKNAVTMDKAKEVLNRMLIKNLEKGDKLTFDDLQNKDKGGLETELKEGRRAMAVRISAETGVGGFVLPGSRVDVIHSTREGQRGSEAKVILENILVKAIDLLPVRPEDRPGMVGGTATLEVTPQEALKLAGVQGTGTLFLLLRPFNDNATVKEADVDPSTIIPPPPPPEKKIETPVVATAPAAATEAPKPSNEDKVAVVTIINGSSVSERVYWLDEHGNTKRSELREAPGRTESTTNQKSDKRPQVDPAALDAFIKAQKEKETTN